MDGKILFPELSQKGKNSLKLFFRFLKENHCFSNYQKAFNSATHDSMKTFQDICNDNIGLILLMSFQWKKTEEGFDFWQNIHIRFNLLVNQLDYNVKS